MSEPATIADAGNPRRAALCLAVAVTAAAVTLLFYTPRFVYWSGVAYPEVSAAPEFGRARWALVQIEDLRLAIGDRHHTVIAWRLLFPVVWHYLRLPSWLFLAMPAVGCLLALWLVAWLSYARAGNWVETWLTTAIFAGLPWFFVSSGWLAYFDSWLVIGLLISAFTPSRTALGLACLLTPWIDERFLLGLPVAFATRMIDRRWIEGRDRQSIGLDLSAILAASLPYPAIRAAAWLWGDPDSAAYVAHHVRQVQGVGWDEYLWGLWSGYRAAWLLVLAVVPLVWRRTGWAWGTCTAIAVAGTAIGGIAIAADMTRTLTMLCPMLLLGVWLWRCWRPMTLPWVLGAVLAANLALPANHVMWGLRIPIHGLPAEIEQWNDPPYPLIVARLSREGSEYFERRQYAEARDVFTQVLALDESAHLCRLKRAFASAALRDLDDARADVELLLDIEPDHADALFLRAAVRDQGGDPQGAAEDLAHALRSAPAGWPSATQARQALEKLSAGASQKRPQSVP
jgi:hypothetical protein